MGQLFIVKKRKKRRKKRKKKRKKRRKKSIMFSVEIDYLTILVKKK